MGIETASGNVIFPNGNAIKYLSEYFDEMKDYVSPYEENPKDVRAISFSPNGDVLNGNVRKDNIMDILESYSAETFSDE
jgi:MoaA/NifB/PqqE/SkfB family radical SAM enzyme